MTDKEIAQRLRLLVKDKGSHPKFHDSVILNLKNKWPLLHKLIKDVEADK